MFTLVHVELWLCIESDAVYLFALGQSKGQSEYCVEVFYWSSDFVHVSLVPC
jgi:hypothetical protein